MLSEEKIEKFKKWLTDRGAEILPPSNEYESLRFKGKQVGVLYKSGKVSNKYTNHTLICFQSNKKWYGKPKQIGRKQSYIKEKRQLLDRDGRACFYCGRLMQLKDMSLEHLIPLSMGGKNNLSNMVLAHVACNNIVGNKPINEKINFAIKNRVERITKNK